MINREIVRANIYLTYRRNLNRLLFFFPTGERLLKQKRLYLIFIGLFAMYQFIIFHLVAIIGSYFSTSMIHIIVNLLIFWSFMNSLRSSTTTLQRYAFPEDYVLLYTARANPYEVLFVRFMTSIILHVIFSYILILFPVLFWVAMYLHLTFKQGILLMVVFFCFIVFLIGMISLYSSITYIIYMRIIHYALSSLVKRGLTLVFVSAMSAITTLVIGWGGYHYFGNQDLFLAVTQFVENFYLDRVFTSEYLPTNWVFNLVANHNHVIYYISLFLLIGVSSIVIANQVVLKKVKIQDVATLSETSRELITQKRGSIFKFSRRLERIMPINLVAIMRKDLLAISRANFVIKKRLYLAAYMLATEIGALIGLSVLQQWFDFPKLLIIYPILFAITYNVSLLGDGLLGITSADAERENLFLYKNSGASLYQLITAKATIHVVIILMMVNCLFIGVLGGFRLEAQTALIIFIAINSMTLILSSAQVIGTFLYPRLDWENYEDIGSSLKASVFEHSILGIVLTLNLNIYGVLGFLLWRNFIGTSTFAIITCVSSIGLLIAFFVFYYYWIKRIGTTNWEVKR
ncbi:hypothetical protein ACUIJN_23060 [Metabacillus halosaccharovorans]|uniref:hypothetical protein n=1 Tax=Metabacillus halosaccharovorans TaxID=930124 RepID=UPI00403D6F38